MLAAHLATGHESPQAGSKRRHHTHYHPDHVGGGMGGHSIAGVAELVAKQPVKVYVHRAEEAGVRKVTGLSESDLAKVDSGDKLALGDVEKEFLHAPGRTPGSQCFRVKNTLVSGDTLFIDGCGRGTFG